MGEVAVNGSNTPPTPSTDTVTIISQPEDATAYVGGEFSFITVADTDDPTATLSYQWQIYTDSTWTDISGATHATYVGTAPLTTGTADYRCVVTSTGGGTATSDSATLTVEAIPIDIVSFTTQPTSYSGYIGDVPVLTVLAESNDETATISYQWQMYENEAWSDISGQTDVTLTIYTQVPLDESFRCIATSDKGGTATSNTATVVIANDTVTITAQPQSASAMVGDTVTLSVTATSNAQGATLSYQWQIKNGSTYDDISGATSSTYTVPTTTAGTERYRVIVTSDKGGTATSNYADVEVVVDTVTIMIQPQSESVEVGSTTSIYVSATSNNPSAILFYQWQQEISSVWTDISGATTSYYVVPTTTVGTESYRVIVTSDKGGTVTSNTATVEVKNSYVKFLIYAGTSSSDHPASGTNVNVSNIQGKACFMSDMIEDYENRYSYLYPVFTGTYSRQLPGATSSGTTNTVTCFLTGTGDLKISTGTDATGIRWNRTSLSNGTNPQWEVTQNNITTIPRSFIQQLYSDKTSNLTKTITVGNTLSYNMTTPFGPTQSATASYACYVYIYTTGFELLKTGKVEKNFNQYIYATETVTIDTSDLPVGGYLVTAFFVSTPSGAGNCLTQYYPASILTITT